MGSQEVNILLDVMTSENFRECEDDTAQDIRATLEEILGCYLPDVSRLQSCLPIR